MFDNPITRRIGLWDVQDEHLIGLTGRLIDPFTLVTGGTRKFVGGRSHVVVTVARTSSWAIPVPLLVRDDSEIGLICPYQFAERVPKRLWMKVQRWRSERPA